MTDLRDSSPKNVGKKSFTNPHVIPNLYKFFRT